MKFFVRAFLKDHRGLQLLILIPVIVAASIWLNVHPLIALLAGLTNGMALSAHIDLFRWKKHAERVETMAAKHENAIRRWILANRQTLRDHNEAIGALFQGVKIIAIHCGLGDALTEYDDPPPWSPDSYGGPSA